MSSTINSDLVTIFILNWNQYNKICQAIDSALNQTYSNCEILIVDNGSTDGSPELIKKTYPSIHLVQLDKNYGCPGGRNRGIPHCKGEYIFFVDDDGVLHKNAVKNAMVTFWANKDAGIVTGKIIDINRLNNFTDDEINNKTYEVGLFQGGISIHKKSIYEVVGMYPDEFMYGKEESFLSLRLIDNNIKIFQNDSVILFHPLNTVLNKPEQHKRSFENTFITAYQLYPLPLFVFFVIYFSTAYLVYAARFGFLSDYLKIYNRAIFRAKKSKRYPVRLVTVLKYRMKNKIS